MTGTQTTQRGRVYATGSCEGFEKLRDSLANHPEIEMVGASTTVAEGAAALAGGHLDAVLHATRGASLPADELAAIREHSRAPVLILASSGSSGLLEQALDADVADVLLLPQLVENIVFAIRKATHTTKRHHDTGLSRHGRIVTVFSPKGGTGKTVTATNLAAACAKFEGRKTLLLDLDLQCSLDVPTLKNLRLALQTLDLLSFPKQRVRIVLNRSNSKVGMKPNEVEGALGMKVRFEVPSDRAVPLSVNRGNPVVLAEESADVSRAIRQMAKELFPTAKEEGKKRRFIPALARS